MGPGVQRLVVLVSLSTMQWCCQWPEERECDMVLGYWLLAGVRRSRDEDPLPENEVIWWCQIWPLCWNPDHG